MTTSAQSINKIHRFTFSEHLVRGELVQLSDAYRALCEKHDYERPVQRLLGELLAVTSLLTATLKFEGHINVQVQGNGPLNFATVNGSHDQKLRGMARVRAPITDESLLGMLGEDALLIITLTPKQGERYQGVVRIEADNLAQAVEGYFHQSEQLATRIWLKVDPETYLVSGFFLQALPVHPDQACLLHQGEALAQQANSFEHLTALANTLTAQELFTLEVSTILHRLYHEEDIRLFEAQTVTFHCGCSRENTATALRSIARDALLEIIEEEGQLSLTCDYCLTTYHYDLVDIEALETQHQAPAQTH